VPYPRTATTHCQHVFLAVHISQVMIDRFTGGAPEAYGGRGVRQRTEWEANALILVQGLPKQL